MVSAPRLEAVRIPASPGGEVPAGTDRDAPSMRGEREMIRSVFVALALTALFAGPALAQGEDEMMKKWKEMATPGENHKWLDQLAGEWETTTKMWMGGAEGEAMESKGSAKFTWTLDGRWLRQEYEGSMMGMPFQGEGRTGYDNFRRKFVTTWTDSMSTALMYAEGTLDQQRKQLICFGPMDEWMTGEVGKMTKEVTRIVDADTFVFEMHDLHIVPGNTLVMEITYKRKK